MNLPLLCLRPLIDERAQWCALRLESETPLAVETVAQLFECYDLATALSGLRCIVDLADPLAESVTTLPLRHLELRLGELPDAAEPQLARLTAAGAHLVAATPDTPARMGVAPWQPLTYASARDIDETPRSDGANRASLLRLLALVSSDAETHAIEQAIKRDPELSFKLLKLVNSVALGGGKITTFAQAIALLGRRQLQRWLQLLLYARSAADGPISPLLPLAALRATWMEELSRQRGDHHDLAEQAYMVGMFSLLDRLFSTPLATLLEPLNLADEVLAALLSGKGPLGPMLAAIVGAEHGRLPPDIPLDRLGISAEAWISAQIAAVRWAIAVTREL